MLAFHCLLFLFDTQPIVFKVRKCTVAKKSFFPVFLFFCFFCHFLYLSFFINMYFLLHILGFPSSIYLVFVFCNLMTLCSFLLFFFFLQDLPMQRMEMLEMFCTLLWQAHIKYGRFTLRTAHG